MGRRWRGETRLRVPVAAHSASACRAGGVCGIPLRALQRRVAGTAGRVGAQQDPHQLRRSVRAANRDPGGTPGSGAVVVLESAGHPATVEYRRSTAFFGRVKSGDKAGYPRFKGKARFDSVEWPKDGDGARWLPEGPRRVYLQGIGQVKVHLHRPVAGKVKTIQIKRQGRRWMLVLSWDDVPTKPLPATGRQAGIDVGISSFATTSDGKHVDNPRWARKAGDRLASAQQRLQRAKRRSHNRDRKRETVAAHHRKVANQRKDFHHKQARRLVESLRPAGGGGPTDRQHASAGQTRARSRQSWAVSTQSRPGKVRVK